MFMFSVTTMPPESILLQSALSQQTLSSKLNRKLWAKSDKVYLLLGKATSTPLIPLIPFISLVAPERSGIALTRKSAATLSVQLLQGGIQVPSCKGAKSLSQSARLVPCFSTLSFKVNDLLWKSKIQKSKLPSTSNLGARSKRNSSSEVI